MRNLNLTDVLEKFRAAIEAGLRVYLVGRIESYDAATQTATVQPLLQDYLTPADDEPAALPVLQGVPVAFPGGGGMRLTFPVAAGDYCELHFADRSLDQWKARGGEVDPLDARRHALSDAVAHVGIRPQVSPWTGADTSVITIGSDGGTAQWVATADRVLTELNKLKTAFDGHTHGVGTISCTGSPGTGVGTSGGAAASASLSAPASATVKVKG